MGAAGAVAPPPPDTTYEDALHRWLGCGCCFDISGGDQQQVERIKERLATNTYHWTGNLCLDYLFHVSNRHPVIAIFLSHPLHPFNKTERFCLEWLRCSGTVAWVVIFEEQVKEGRRERHESLSQAHDHAWLFLFTTLPISLIRAVLQAVAVETGRPGGILERVLGEGCACAIQWYLMLSCFSLVCFLSTICFWLIFVPGPWNAYGQDAIDISMTYVLAWHSVQQGWLSWFLLDLVMPSRLSRCPWAFGFYLQWRREKEEAEAALEKSISSGSSGSSSGDESNAGCPKWRC